MRYKLLLILLVIMAVLGAAVGGVAYHYWDRIVEYELPKAPLVFSQIKPPSSVEIVDSNDRVIEYIAGEHHQIYRPLGQISKTLQNFVVMLEDAKFYNHNGFDVEQIRNSLEENWEEGKVKRGGSTITQQLAKNMFLDKSRSFLRKAFEVPWTMRIEHDLKKNQILELYLNIIEWGPGIYGAEAAARHYFDRTASDLDIGQAMYLALIIPNPPRFDLFEHPNRRAFLETKKKWLVDRLVGEKKIPESSREAYMNSDFGLVAPDAPNRHFPVLHIGSYFGNRSNRSYIQDYLKGRIRELVKLSGKSLRVKTSIDIFVQNELQDVAVVTGGSDGEHFGVITENGKIRALRKLGSGQSLDPEGLSHLTSVEYGAETFQNYNFEERKEILAQDLL